jgi:serine/threonine protein kinase
MTTQDLVGHKLGEYEIIEQVGRGATANVYKALQPKLNRHVAIKVLSPLVADEGAFRKRFTREAQAIARLDHPNILPVYDFDQQDNLVYIVMQYVDTGSLADLMGEPMSPECALEILEQVGSALSYAHKRGIIHRDVKPGNILIGQDNWVLLTDFGLVKILEDPATITLSGVGMGTPNYMAPEQVRGDIIDSRADIYSMGVMLYQMVTGDVPFEGETGIAVALKHLNEIPTPPQVINPSLSPAVDRVIIKALAKDRESRYQSADEFVAAFRQAVTGIGDITETIISTAQPARQPTATRTQACPSPAPAPTPILLEHIWPELDKTPAPKGGGGWTLLLTLVCTLAGFFLLFWGLAHGLSMLIERLP